MKALYMTILEAESAAYRCGGLDAAVKSLIVHSVPTIWGLRPANILTLRKSELAARVPVVAELESLLYARSLSVKTVHESENAIQIMIYKSKELAVRLMDAECRDLLASCGYSVEDGIEAILDRLSERMRANNGFPHEIGVFLGYPPEDVMGFVRNKGKNYKYNGYWKVYGDVEQCKRRFAAYDSCRRHAACMLKGGATMEDIINCGVRGA